MPKTLATNGKPMTSGRGSSKSSKPVTASPATIQAQAAAAAMIQPYLSARLQNMPASAACMNVNPYLRYNPALAAAAAAASIKPYATAGYPPPSVNSVSPALQPIRKPWPAIAAPLVARQLQPSFPAH